MKRIKIYLSLLLVITLLSVSTVHVLADEYVNDDDVESKLSEKLIELISNQNEDIIPVIIFLKSCDKTAVFQRLQEKYGYDTDAYEDYYRYESEIIPNIKVGDKTIGNLIGDEKYSREIIDLDNKESRLDISIRRKINDAIVKNANAYLRDYRREVATEVKNYVDSFVEANKDYIEDIALQLDCAEFVIVSVKSDNIMRIANQDLIENIDYYEDLQAIPESWNANSVVEADSVNGLGSSFYNGGSGYDGSGITVGIIEMGGKYDPNDYNLTDADLTFVDTVGVSGISVSGHATNVTSLICAKETTIDGKVYKGLANGATVIQTGTYGSTDLIHAIEMFIELNVNVINYSAGIYYGTEYSAVDQAVDNLLFVNRMSFVKSAGNLGMSTCQITTPGKAYNAITVGNLTTKDFNEALSSPYALSAHSSTAEDSFIANKPDVVAPGTSLCLPVSENEVHIIGSGTSYSAPIVTGMVAQLMQYSGMAILNPNCAKNHIICGASNNDVTGTTLLSTGALTDESGAGLVNAVNTLTSTNYDNKYYGAYSVYKSVPTEYKTVAVLNLKRRDHLRIALTFEKEENISLDSEYGNNIDMRLVRDNPHSSYLVKSESTNNNVELIDTTINITGEYWLQIRFKNSILDAEGNPHLHYWISWRTY